MQGILWVAPDFLQLSGATLQITRQDDKLQILIKRKDIYVE